MRAGTQTAGGEDIFPALPRGKFAVVHADPPWD